MRRRTLLALLLATAATIACAPEKPSGPERIILIVVDTLRADHVGVYGGPRPTPNMDALAARGQVFRNAVSSYFQTSMSMAGLMTGLVPSLESGDLARALRWEQGNRCGMTRFRSPDDDACMPDAVTTISEDLEEAGYWTAAVVANPLLFRPYGHDQGFEEWIEVGTIPRGVLRQKSKRKDAESRRGEVVNEAVAALLRDRPTDRFFLYVHYLDVHDWLLLSRGYAHSVEIQDALLGDLMDILEREQLLEGATIVLTADHGEALGEEHALPATLMHFGNPAFEPVIRVPLIVAPKVFEDTDSTIRGLDVRNLVRRIAGLEALPQAAPSNALYLSERRYRTYRDGRYKSMWPRREGEAALFDLESDPGESTDVSAEHPEIMEAHGRAIRERVDRLAAQPLGSRDADAEDDLERLRALGYIE